MVFGPQWIVAMATLVPLICVLSVLLGVIVSSRVSDPWTAQQFGAFVVLPIIAIAGRPVPRRPGDVHGHPGPCRRPGGPGLIRALLVIGSWAFDREEILTRLG